MECPNCRHNFEVHTCITGEKVEMRDGDVTICFNCGEVYRLWKGALNMLDIKYLPVEHRNEIKRIIAIIQLVK